MVRVALSLTRKSMALLTALLLVVFWVPGIASAAPLPPPAPSRLVGGFEIDGDFVASNMITPGDDWNNVSVVSTSDPTGTADTTNFSGGSKECTSGGDCSSDNWTGATGTAPNKADISNVYVSTRLRPNVIDSTKTDVWGFFGLTRVDNSGSVFYDIELNQADNHIHNGISVPTRTDKDVLIILDQNGNGDFSFSGSIQKWVDASDPASCQSGLVKPCWGVQTSLSGLGVLDFYGRSNSGTIAGYQGVGSLADDLFGEVGVNLSAAGAILGCPSTGFTKMNVRSKASPGSPTASDGDVTGSAEIKDFVAADVGIPSACGELIINKYGPGTSTTHVPGATFTIDPNPIPGQTGTLTIRDADTGTNADGNGDGIIDIDPAKPGTYTVTETVPPPGYFLPAVTVHSNVVVTEFGSGANATVTNFHDPLGSITVTKTGNGGSLSGSTFTLTGPDSYSNTVFDSASGTNNDGAADGTLSWTNLKTGTYTLHEDSAPTGYDTVADQTFVIQDSVVDNHHGRDLSVTINDPKKTTTLSVWKYHTETDSSKTNIPGAVFSLYQSDSNVAPSAFDSSGATLVGSCTTAAVTGVCAVPTDSPNNDPGTHVITWDHYYYWVEQSVPWPYTVPDVNVFGPVHITAANITDSRNPTPADDPRAVLTTTATASVKLPLAAGTGISDTAHLSGVPSNAGGVIVFNAYGPDPASCTGTPAYTFTKTGIAGPNDYTSGTFTPTTAGAYKWAATYYPNGTGDTTHTVAASCSDPTELSTVQPATPTMNTVATDTNTVDGTFYDEAFLHDFAAPSQPLTVTFTLYTTSNCAAGTDVFTSTNAVDGTGHAKSGLFTADNTHGTYYWRATLNLNGDVNNTTANIGDDCGSTAGTNHEVSKAPVIPTPTKSPASGTVKVYAPDNTITYTVTVQNTGGSTANGVTVTDPIDAGATFDTSLSCTGSVSGCTFTQPSGVPTWSFDLAAGGTVTIQFRVIAKPGDSDGQLIHNQAKVTNGQTDLFTNTTEHTVIRPLLALGKNANPLPVEDDAANGAVAPGQTITYTLPLSNTGSDAANGVVVTDQVPAHTSYNGAAPAHCENPTTHATVACTAGHSGASPDVVTWTVNVPAKTTVDLVFSVIVADKASLTNGDVIPNQGHFTWTYSDVSNGPNLTGDSRQIHHVVKFPVLTQVKTATPAPRDINGNGGVVHPNGTIHYVVTVHNGGQADATGVVVTDAIPTGTTYVANSAVPAATLTNGVLSWTVTVAAGGDTQVAFDVTVNANDADGFLINNTATVNGVDTNTTTHIVEIPIVSVVKSSNPATGTVAQPTLVGPNTTIGYTLTVTNAGRQDATGFVVTDQVPAGTTYNDDASCNGAAACSVSTNTVGGVTTITWTLTVPGGTVSNNVVTPTTRTLTFSITTPAVQSKLIDNTASFTNENTPGCDAASQTCDTNTTHHEVVFPVINAHKTSDPASGTVGNPATVTPGQVITYTIAVDNSGQADASQVSVSDVVPAGVTYVPDSATASGGTYDAGTNTVSWTINAAKGTTTILTFQAKVPDNATNGTLIDNTATFSNVHTPNCLPAGETTCSTETTHHEVRFAVLTLAKSSNPVSGSIVQRGDRIDYTVTLTNTGLASAQKTITDTLPDHVTLVDGSAVPAFTSVNGNVVTWAVNVPAATVGETTVPGTVVLTYSVTVDKDAPEGATLTNVALVDGECVGNADAAACTTDHHVPTGALTLVKHVDKTTANYGDTLTYTFDASTTGALNQTAVVVSDVLPKGTAYVGSSAKCTDAGTCTASFNGATKTVTWLLGDMAAGTTRHLVFKVTIVTPSFDSTVGLPPLTIVNSGTIASTETPSTPSNQVVTKVVAVLGVKVVRKPPKLPFTGVPAQEMLFAGLLMVGAGIILTSVRRREH